MNREHLDDIYKEQAEAEREAMEELLEPEEDVVNKPSHYRNGSFEVIDEMIIAFGPNRTYDFCIMNAWKYRSRAPFKGNIEQDMDKANRYMEMAREIQKKNCERMEWNGKAPVLIKKVEGGDGTN